MPHVLEGIKVIDLAINYAGPATSMYLADQGADVIKIERRKVGDTARRAGNTPFLKLNSRHFMAINRGKRSITVDITKPAGQQIVRELAERADVLVENFGQGVMERLGIGYEQLSALNPRLIYASITAYGRKGPYSDKAGFDRLVQGMSGAMYRKDAQGRPQGTGVWIADWAAPMLTAYGIGLALLERERTGQGQRVDASLLHAAIAMQFGEMTICEDDPDPPREENPSGYNCYLCADGVYINIGAFFHEQHQRLCKALDLEHLADDDRFLDPGRRGEIYQETGPIFEAIFATESSQHWLDVLNEADVPCAPILTRARVPYEEQIIANEMMVPVQHPVVGRTRITGTPVKLSKNPSVELRPAPVLGEHTESILGDLGYSEGRIAELETHEVISARPRLAKTPGRANIGRRKVDAFGTGGDGLLMDFALFAMRL